MVEQRTPGYYTLAVPDGRGLFETIREFSELDEVLFAEPSEVSFNDALAYIPDDPDFGRLWGLRNTGQTVNGVGGTADADIDATEAWDLTRGDPEVIVAVIDTGADLDHADLAGQHPAPRHRGLGLRRRQRSGSRGRRPDTAPTSPEPSPPSTTPTASSVSPPAAG